MEHCMDEYQDRFTVLYLNELLIYLATFEQHLEHLGKTSRTLASTSGTKDTWYQSQGIQMLSIQT